MRQIVWTNFAISELKNIFLYYKMFAAEKTADKI
jgi:plasmid stabilization system protein ParE